MTKRLLELFCGTKSVGKVFSENSYEVISLDFNPKFNATHTEDILTWDYTIYPSDYFEVIWASPDCRTWSLATGGKYRKKDNIYGLNNEYQDEADLGNNMILRVIEILKYFNCKAWFIENPKALLQHYPPLKEFIKQTNSNMNVVYYGNYNDWDFPKATNIWSNLPLWDNEPKPIMNEDKYTLKYHNYDKRMKKHYKFSNMNAEERSKIPPDLIRRLYNLI
jgi:site-specific DNA-cytosine methylase